MRKTMIDDMLNGNNTLEERDDDIIGQYKGTALNKQDKKDYKEFKKIERITKIKRFFSFYDLRKLVDEVKSLGYSLSMNTLGMILLALVLLSFICSVLLKVKVQYLIVLGVMLIACMPYAVLMTFASRFEERRFNNIVGYMEQLIYAFHKSGKIRNSLVDVYEVSTGDIKRCIKDMLDVIDNDDTTSRLYEKAFAIMENRYNCTRLKVIHDYLISVEANGGDPSASLKILLEDLRAWVERVGMYQAERKNVRVKTAISICCALLSCGIMINLIPQEYVEQIVEYTIYQIGTVIVLALNIVVYMISCTQLSMSYLDNEIDKKYSSRIRRAAEFLANWSNKNHVKTSLIKAGAMIPLIGASIYFNIPALILLSALMMFMFLTHDFSYKASCLKKVTREIKKTFPIWLRSLILHLQVDNVHVAIRNSYDNCPEILRPELETFMEGLTQDPITMKPYNNFLGTYEVPDLKLATHYLYSIATFGSEDVLSQLDYLIEQTGKLEIVEEKIRNEDSIATFSLIILTPMLLAVIKLMIDLVLFLNIFMGYLSMAF